MTSDPVDPVVVADLVVGCWPSATPVVWIRCWPAAGEWATWEERAEALRLVSAELAAGLAWYRASADQQDAALRAREVALGLLPAVPDGVWLARVGVAWPT